MTGMAALCETNLSMLMAAPRRFASSGEDYREIFKMDWHMVLLAVLPAANRAGVVRLTGIHHAHVQAVSLVLIGVSAGAFFNLGTCGGVVFVVRWCGFHVGLRIEWFSIASVGCRSPQQRRRSRSLT